MADFNNIMVDARGYITKKETKLVLDGCTRPKDYLLILILARSGIRVSECINIKARDINNRKITIRQLKTKTKTYRNACIDIKTDRECKTYIRKCNLKPDDYVFYSNNNKKKHISRQYAFMIVKKCCEQVGIKKIGNRGPHPHNFRHGLAIQLLDAGVDIRKIQIILGHQSYATTASYLRFGGAEIQADYDKVINDEEDD